MGDLSLEKSPLPHQLLWLPCPLIISAEKSMVAFIDGLSGLFFDRLGLNSYCCFKIEFRLLLITSGN